MAFFPQTSPPPPLGQVARDGLENIRLGFYQLAHVKGASASMSTEQQFKDATGFGTGAKAELDSGLGYLLNGDPGVNGAQIKAAVDQMLNQFG